MSMRPASSGAAVTRFQLRDDAAFNIAVAHHALPELHRLGTEALQHRAVEQHLQLARCTE